MDALYHGRLVQQRGDNGHNVDFVKESNNKHQQVNIDKEEKNEQEWAASQVHLDLGNVLGGSPSRSPCIISTFS